jgi:hypothetical protein
VNSESDLLASKSQVELRSVMSDILKSNIDLQRRLLRLESLLGSTAETLREPTIRRVNTAAVTSTTTRRQLLSINLEENADDLSANSNSSGDSFEKVLQSSWVYRRIQNNSDRFSIASGSQLGQTWSVLSRESSLADVSLLSVVALPIDWSEVSNPHRYIDASQPTNLDPDGLDAKLLHILNRTANALNQPHNFQIQQTRQVADFGMSQG